MPSVPIKDLDQYEKAINVLNEVGGSYQGVGVDEWFLLVNDRQYQALIEADVVAPETSNKDKNSGKKKRKKT